MVGIASKTFQTTEKSCNGNPLRFQNNIPNHLKKLRCISPCCLRCFWSGLSCSLPTYPRWHTAYRSTLPDLHSSRWTPSSRRSSQKRAPYNTNGAGVLFAIKALGLEGKGPRPRGKGLLQNAKEPSRTMFNRLIVWQTIRFNITTTQLTTTTYGLW